MAGLAAYFLADDGPTASPRLLETMRREGFAAMCWACDEVNLPRPGPAARVPPSRPLAALSGLSDTSVRVPPRRYRPIVAHRALVFAVAVMAVLAACGDDDASTTTTTFVVGVETSTTATADETTTTAEPAAGDRWSGTAHIDGSTDDGINVCIGTADYTFDVVVRGRRHRRRGGHRAVLALHLRRSGRGGHCPG